MKWAANSMMSSRRSRNGGSVTVITFSRWYKSCRNFPSATAASRSRCVADTTRTFTLIGSLLPMRKTSLFSSTRSSLACNASGMSPTSSRNSVPPLAYSNRPLRGLSAPVKAPASWPNSSSSSRFSLRAVQFISANGLFFRGLLLWMARAASSLPVPVSPRISTVALVGAMACSRLMTSCILRAVADDALKAETLVELAAQVAVGPRQPQPFGRPVHDGPQLGHVHRLGEVVGGALLDGLHGGFYVAVAGNHHHLGVGRLFPGLAQDGQAVQVRHLQIGQDDVEIFLGQQAGAGRAAGGHGAFVTDPFQALGHGFGVETIVVDDQDFQPLAGLARRGGFGGAGHGSRLASVRMGLFYRPRPGNG